MGTSATVPHFNYNLTVNGVNCSLLMDGSQRQTIDLTPDNIAAAVNMRFICDWNDRYTLMDGIQYTAHPNVPWAYACLFDFEPAGNDIGGTPTLTADNTLAQAIVTANYKSLRYNFDYLEITATDDVELLTIDKATGQFVDPSSGTPATDAPTAATQAATNYFTLKVPFAHIEINYHNQPTFDEQTANSMQGQLNSDAWSPNPFNPSSMSYAKGCAQYVSYSYRTFIGPEGTWLYDYTYKFIARGNGTDFNQEFNPHTGKFAPFSLKNSMNPKYTNGNFSTLSAGAVAARDKRNAMLKRKNDALRAAVMAGNEPTLKQAFRDKGD